MAGYLVVSQGDHLAKNVLEPLPRLTYEVRGTAERSLWARRHRAIAWFVDGLSSSPWLDSV